MKDFREKIECMSEKVPEGGCWIWNGCVDKDGYGILTINRKQHGAHRISFQQFVRNIRPGEWILHHCDNPSCVNPYHLYGGNAYENRMDALKRNRWTNSFGRRNECSAGHPYIEGDFKISNRDGSRICKICRKETKQKARDKLKMSHQPLVKR